MTVTTILYHPIHAPDGQRFETDGDALKSYADEGWVDNPAKIGVNPWGDDHKRDVARRHLEYLSGELPGISPRYGSHVGSTCAIWNTVATLHDKHGSLTLASGWPPASPHVTEERQTTPATVPGETVQRREPGRQITPEIAVKYRQNPRQVSQNPHVEARP